ncbi:hypothetical protein BGZ50_002582 [Haplosporangium sp. Z 11]|nr:hypothetical protein BGZ50_002582 [Haplosporangium sp. Z 11]
MRLNADNENKTNVDDTAATTSASFSTALSQPAVITSTPTSTLPRHKRKLDVEGRAMKGGKQTCNRTTIRDPNAVSVTTDDIQRKDQYQVSSKPDDPGNDDSLDLCEIDELVARITSVKHKECDTWVLDDECVPCLIEKYQEDSIKALRRRELKKSEPADTMILAGTFAPWSPTTRMVRIFTHQRLKKLRESLKNDVDMIDIDDGCIQRAIRYKMNEDESSALDELQGLKDRKLRMLFEQLIVNLPRKERSGYSEETLVVNFIAPILRTFLHHTKDDIHTHFPNTESDTQKKQGIRADKPDFKVMISDKEVSFGEVTGHAQRSDKAKNGWDLWRLVRFGKSVLDEGAPMVPLVQVVYDEGTVYRHFVRTRGVMVLAEVGVFTVPMHVNGIGSLQASLPVLYWYKDAVYWLQANPEWQKRSWKAADLADIKKYHC